MIYFKHGLISMQQIGVKAFLIYRHPFFITILRNSYKLYFGNSYKIKVFIHIANFLDGRNLSYDLGDRNLHFHIH
jgi:hypothetical protein